MIKTIYICILRQTLEIRYKCWKKTVHSLTEYTYIVQIHNVSEPFRWKNNAFFCTFCAQLMLFLVFMFVLMRTSLRCLQVKARFSVKAEREQLKAQEIWAFMVFTLYMCVCVCPGWASLPAVCTEPLRDYSRTAGHINTAALNHGAALISSQVAAFHKHCNKRRFIYLQHQLQFTPASLQ